MIHFFQSALVLLIVLWSGNSYAADCSLNRNGKGEYEIATYTQLKAIGVDCAIDQTYRLVADIDALDSRGDDSNKGFAPIGSLAIPFTGQLHGGGYAIRNLIINRSSQSAVGLFAFVKNATIDSLQLVQGSITGDKYVGAVAGQSETSTLFAVFSSSNVVGSQYVGGVVGYNKGDIKFSSTTGSVKGESSVGGIAGEHNSDTIQYSFATGDITATGSKVGGVIGSNGSAVLFCYATGSVMGGGKAIGGLVGVSDNGNILNSYATGMVTGESTVIGGLVGNCIYCSTKYSYAVGYLATSKASSGALLGQAELSTTDVSDLYWSRDYSGQALALPTNSGSPAINVVELDYAGMRLAASYPALDFGDNWSIVDNQSLPMLQKIRAAPFAYNFALDRLPSGDRLEEWDNVKVVWGYSSVPEAQLIGVLSGVARLNPTADSIYYFFRVGAATAVDTLWGGTARIAVPNDVISIADYAELSKIGHDAHYPLCGMYRLTADIDASASAKENAGAGFIPIGSQESPFSGQFSGAGHVIVNLTITRPDQDYVGLFGYTSGHVTIDSLGLPGIRISGHNYVGGLVGYHLGLAISQTYTTGSLAGTGHTFGGLVGEMGAGSLSNSYSTVEVPGHNTLRAYNLAGLVGLMASGTAMAHCYAVGPVTPATSGLANVSGLIGYSYIKPSASFWNSEQSLQVDGTSNGIAQTTYEMKRLETYSDSSWDFARTWQIVDGLVYPGLVALDNAPFAYNDTIFMTGSYSWQGLLANDYDLETQRKNLVCKPISYNAIKLKITKDSLYFSDNASLYDTLQVIYRVGEVRTGDTLWGNIAKAHITYALSGKGSDDAPYLVQNYTDLKHVEAMGMDKVYRLAANIDASASAGERCSGNSCMGFSPIGGGGEVFTGRFRGAGHSIRKLYINASGDHVGLFRRTSGSNVLIDSLALLDNEFIGGNRLGGIVGYNYLGTIRYSYVTGALSGGDVGGIVGENSGLVEFCYTTGSIQGSGSVGGIVGDNMGGTVQESYSTASLANKFGGVGGLIGYHISGTLSHGYAANLLTSKYASGGLIGTGYNHTISGSYWDVQTSRLSLAEAKSQQPVVIQGAGLTSSAMRQEAMLSDLGDFSASGFWQILDGYSYPGLRGLDNAPFAFADTLLSTTQFSLLRLLYNDYDIETRQKNLVLFVDSLSSGTTDSISTLEFPPTALLGDTLHIVYRVGEARALDTLWGNRAIAHVVLGWNLGLDSVHVYGDAPFELVTKGIGNAVAITSSKPEVASVVDKKVTLHHAGCTELTALSVGVTLKHKLCVEPRNLMISAASLSKVYGRPDSVLTYTVEGFVSNDTPEQVLSGRLERAPGEDVAEYVISLGSLKASSDYAIDFTPSILTITPAQLRLGVQDTSMAWGNIEPSYHFIVDGLVNEDDASVLVNLHVAHPLITGPGTYELLPSAHSANYRIDVYAGKLTVTKAVSLAQLLDDTQVGIYAVAGGINVFGFQGNLLLYDMNGTLQTITQIFQDGFYRLPVKPGNYVLRYGTQTRSLVLP